MMMNTTAGATCIDSSGSPFADQNSMVCWGDTYLTKCQNMIFTPCAVNSQIFSSVHIIIDDSGILLEFSVDSF